MEDVPTKSACKLECYRKRSRIRTEQLRKKRKEIKVIDSCLVEQIIKQSKKRKPSKSAASALNVNNNNTVSKEKKNKHYQTKYVQLHGVPVGTTYETVRKFFTGLVPRRIVLLLSNRVKVMVLDGASYGLNTPKNREYVYANTDLRVLVEFDSISEALLARDRSKEIIFAKQLDQTTPAIDTVNRPNSFSIGVTMIPKEMTTSLSNLSIDAIPGFPLHSCLSEVESNLDPLIRAILWTKNRQECGVAVDDEIKNSDLDILAMKIIGHDDLLLSLSEYQRYAKYYNRLAKIYHYLKVPPDDVDEANFSLDPLTRLTSLACSVLDSEMDRIDTFLYQVRTTKRMRNS